LSVQSRGKRPRRKKVGKTNKEGSDGAKEEKEANVPIRYGTGLHGYRGGKREACQANHGTGSRDERRRSPKKSNGKGVERPKNRNKGGNGGSIKNWSPVGGKNRDVEG